MLQGTNMVLQKTKYGVAETKSGFVENECDAAETKNGVVENEYDAIETKNATLENE